MITKDTIQTILSRLDIIDVVGDYVKLKKRGSNYIGLCPFHNEKSPSFSVSASKEIYKCFGCGKSGNAVSFVMEHDKLSYVEALRMLAKKYNVEIEETATDPSYAIQQQQADALYILNQFARTYYEDVLWKHELGQAIGYTYLQERGFTDETIRKFGLGYGLSERQAFAKTALAAQYNAEVMVSSGLVIARDEGLVDNYRDRIIFPIQNPIGKVIGFGARLIKANDKAPKYINTPENEVYVKSKVLYGIHQSRMAIDKANECLLVEGYTDVISLHQAGVENVVSSSGTSLTQDQLRLIKKYTSNITIVYDGDGAGIKAALRGMDMALEEGLQVQLVLIPDGHDPDSYVRQVGKLAFTEFIASHKKDFILFQLELGLREAGNDSGKKKDLVNRIAESISKINRAADFTRQQDYIRQAAAALKADEGGLTALVNTFIGQKIEKQLQQTQRAESKTLNPEAEPNDKKFDDNLTLLIGNEVQERALVKVLLVHGLLMLTETQTVAQYIFEALESFHFDSELLSQVYWKYKEWYDAGVQPTEKSFLYYDDTEMAKLVISMLTFPYELSARWEKMNEGKRKPVDTSSIDEARHAVDFFRLRKLKVMLEQNQQELEATKDPEQQTALMKVHLSLKEYEMNITNNLGTVIMR
ncbi:MAG: DNA primase [Bacteroidetes bacterium]|nr:MAG: DNA primase [Bacteroidota bacterium]